MSVRARVWWGEVGGAPWDPREVHGIGFLGKGVNAGHLSGARPGPMLTPFSLQATRGAACALWAV